MKDSRYPNGYTPKIEYWQHKMNQAIELRDAGGISYAVDRLVYFVSQHEKQMVLKSKQRKLYGKG